MSSFMSVLPYHTVFLSYPKYTALSQHIQCTLLRYFRYSAMTYQDSAAPVKKTLCKRSWAQKSHGPKHVNQQWAPAFGCCLLFKLVKVLLNWNIFSSGRSKHSFYFAEKTEDLKRGVICQMCCRLEVAELGSWEAAGLLHGAPSSLWLLSEREPKFIHFSLAHCQMSIIPTAWFPCHWLPVLDGARLLGEVLI